MAKSMRGRNTMKKGMENREKVRAYFKVFPQNTLEECKAITGLSTVTCSKYRKELFTEQEKSA